MTNKQKSIPKIKQILIFGLFFIAAVFISLLMPREGSFKYEYYRGKPWKYENLTAPFDFGIYKTETELGAERDSILKEFPFYFKYSDNSLEEPLKLFFENFDTEWGLYTIREYKISNVEAYENNRRYIALRELQGVVRDSLSVWLTQVYETGIISFPEDNKYTISPETRISLLKGNISQETTANKYYSNKEAYQYITNKINILLDHNTSRHAHRYKSFFSRFDINQHLNANVIFDQETTEKEMAVGFNNISLTKEKIQQGELIIAKGEIVTQQKFQVLESLKRDFSRQKGNVGNVLTLTGRFILVLIILSIIYFFLYSFRREVLHNLLKTTFILFIQVVILLVASLTTRFGNVNMYIVPFTILPIILRTFYDERLAFFIHVMTIILAGFMATNSYEFVFLNIVAGIVAILTLTNLYRRSRFFLAAFVVFITYSVTYFGILVVQEGSFTSFEPRNLLNFLANGLLLLMTFLLIYIFEKIFGFLSDTTLMELSDTNQPLLRSLAENAPGTFQHSMQVASLAEEAAIKVGGNPLLIRTGALYHDIGKSLKPEFFTENQDKEFNPHNQLESKSSAKVIIDHISKGVELARKNKLPEPIIDFIRTHQGTATVHYFYRMFIKDNPGKLDERNQFQYPGPRPQTKEQAILMMADSIEAASRSLKNYSEESIDELVESIINVQMGESQFDEAEISFKEIKMVKQVFKDRLKNIYHARIAYPKAKES